MSDRHHYLPRYQRVIDYIYEHLDEPLDLIQLAEVAHMSPTHWHRVYAAICGETLATTVKRLRLHRAAGQLINSDIAVDRIADASGYRSLQSFSRAFSQVYGMPPARFRREGSHTRFMLEIRSEEPSDMADENNMDVRIECFEAPLQMVGVEHRGPYMEIGAAFEKLNGWMMEHQVWPHLKAVIGVYHDDPGSVAPENLRSHACAALKESHSLEVPENFEQLSIEAGRYAVLRFKGPYAGLQQAYRWFYGIWLPQSGEELANRPCFEDYLNNPREVAPEELLTDVYMPLAK